MAVDRKKVWALWRYSVLGPLVSARLEHGDQRNLIREASSRRHENPDGVLVKLSARTIEGWLYAWRRGGLDALERDDRGDRGTTRIREELQELLVALKRENLRRSIPRLIRMLERSGEARRGELTKSSVQRFLKRQHLSARGPGEPRERRSFLHSTPGELWMGDVLHGPRVLAGGRVRKSYLIAFIDSATRFVPAAELRLSESAVDHEYALKQAFLKSGLPGAIYLDNGAAQTAKSLAYILADLGVHLVHAEARDPQAKGAIERWNRTFREEVESELPAEPLPIEEVRSFIWSWLSVEYNDRVHSTTGRSPRQQWLSSSSVARSVPAHLDLDEVFLHRQSRVVRGDGTVRFRGRFLEVRSSLVGEEVELRFDPHEDDPRVRVWAQGEFVCDATALDREANAYRKRHRPPQKPGGPPAAPTGLNPLELLREEHLKKRRPHTKDAGDADSEKGGSR